MCINQYLDSNYTDKKFKFTKKQERESKKIWNTTTKKKSFIEICVMAIKFNNLDIFTMLIRTSKTLQVDPPMGFFLGLQIRVH